MNRKVFEMEVKWDDVFYGYIVQDALDENRCAHVNGGWTACHGKRLFTKAGALKFIDEQGGGFIILRG